MNSFNKKTFTVALFLDLKKAFDTVDRGILLKKLEHYGIRHNILNLFKSYFTDRRQYVSLNDFNSSTKILNTGVIQGSVCGPILFNLFINDIVNISDFNCSLFADDAVFYLESDSFEDLIFRLRSFIDIFYPLGLILTNYVRMPLKPN